MAKQVDKKSRIISGSNALITLLAAIGILILINFFVAPHFFARADLTQNKIHTLSEASKSAVQALDDLTVRVFISEPLPDSVKLGYGQNRTLRGADLKLRDILEEYKAFSDGRMSISYVTDNVEAEAEKAKLTLFTSEEAKVDKGRLEFERYALGATFHYKNVKEVYPLAIDPATFEFDITKILVRLKDKYEKSLLMKDMLSKGKEVFDAVESCNKAVQATVKDDADGGEDGLKGLMAAAEQRTKDITEMRSKKPEIEKSCQLAKDKMAAHNADLRKHKNEYVEILLGDIDQFMETLDAFLKALDSTEAADATVATELRTVIDTVFKEVDNDHNNLVNSPGQKRIGFVCGHGEFCPFANDEQLVRPEMAALLGQNNPMTQQIIGQAQQIEQIINQINQGINQNLFKRNGFDIAKIDLNNQVPDDIEALVLFGPTQKLNDRELFELDQFAMRGKSIVVLSNVWDISVLNIKPGANLGDEPDMEYTAITENPHNINDFLTHFGITIQNDLVMEPVSHDPIVLTVTTGPANSRLRWQTQRAFPYPLLPSFDNLNSEHVLLRGVDNLTLPYVSSIRIDAQKQPGVTADVLVQSSANAVVRDAAGISSGGLPLLPPETINIARSSQATGVVPVAVLVTGEAASAFVGKTIPTKPTAEDATEEDKKKAADEDKARKIVEKGTIRILVIASNLGIGGINAKDILAGFDMSKVAQGGMNFINELQNYQAKYQNWQLRITQIRETVEDNLRLLFNIMDWGVQNDALVQIRSKGYLHRPLKNVTETTQSITKYANIIGVPFLFVLFGVGAMAVRKSRKSRLSV